VGAHGSPAVWREEDKRPEDIGKYLNPEAFGVPKTMGIHYVEDPSAGAELPEIP